MRYGDLSNTYASEQSPLVKQIAELEAAKEKAEHELGTLRATIMVNKNRGTLGKCAQGVVIAEDASTLSVLLTIFECMLKDAAVAEARVAALQYRIKDLEELVPVPVLERGRFEITSDLPKPDYEGPK